MKNIFNGLLTKMINEGVILDKRVKELTLDQIAEKFGIEVSQLKIKK